MNILKNKWVMGGSVAVLVIALGYYFWNTTSTGPLLTGGEEGASPLSQEILATLSQIHTIELNPKLFTDPSFVSLTDFGVTIPPQQAGRRNPFEPVGSTGTAAPSTPAILPEAAVPAQ